MVLKRGSGAFCCRQRAAVLRAALDGGCFLILRAVHGVRRHKHPNETPELRRENSLNWDCEPNDRFPIMHSLTTSKKLDRELATWKKSALLATSCGSNNPQP
ncbi:hypothetical protein Tcan_10291 [Toxocara canis]|uniref:Uncharacterized protein n=1 Tax=Toxocara canis TaxID=6265 RepID=A0A0B2UN14_TOXCA|nr:hypothetical protein Tcan_10291 [Toxocara canis]